MNLIGLKTLLAKEVLRFMKVYLQTLVAPVVTSFLFLIIFSHVFGERMSVYDGVSYTAFLIPGLIMMSMIQNAFANSSSSLIQSKVTGNLIFVLVTPLSNLEIFLAFVAASAIRGILVGAVVYAVALAFLPVAPDHPFYVIVMSVLSCAMLGALGLIAGMWAEKFDQMAGFTNFIIVPLSFLSGVFYSVHSLPDFWKAASHANPFFYMVDGFRYGFYGVSDVSPWLSIVVTLVSLALVSAWTLYLLRRGYKLRD